MTLELPDNALYEYAQVVRFIREYADEGIQIDKILIHPAQAEFMNEWPWIGFAQRPDPPQDIVFLGTIFGKHELNIVYNKPKEESTDEKQPIDPSRIRPEEKPRAGETPARPASGQGVSRSHKKGKARRASKR